MALPGESGQRPIDQRAPTTRVTALHRRVDGQGDPIGLRDRGIRQREQAPGVGAQRLGGVVADRLHQPTGPARRDTLRDQAVRATAYAWPAPIQEVYRRSARFGVIFGRAASAATVTADAEVMPPSDSARRNGLADTRPQSGPGELDEYIQRRGGSES